jgi:two-component system chemotaxis response regulator CheY
VDDIAESRMIIRRMIESTRDISVVGEARSGIEAIELYDKLKPDVVSMDINMPEMDGIVATETICESHSEAMIFMRTIQNDPDYVRRSFLAGAHAYLVIPTSREELVRTIRALAGRPHPENGTALARPPVPPGSTMAPRPLIPQAQGEMDAFLLSSVDSLRRELNRHSLISSLPLGSWELTGSIESDTFTLNLVLNVKMLLEDYWGELTDPVVWLELLVPRIAGVLESVSTELASGFHVVFQIESERFRWISSCSSEVLVDAARSGEMGDFGHVMGSILSHDEFTTFD